MKDYIQPQQRIPREPKRLRRWIVAVLVSAFVLWLMLPRPAPLVHFKVTATQSR